MPTYILMLADNLKPPTLPCSFKLWGKIFIENGKPGNPLQFSSGNWEHSKCFPLVFPWATHEMSWNTVQHGRHVVHRGKSQDHWKAVRGDQVNQCPPGGERESWPEPSAPLTLFLKPCFVALLFVVPISDPISGSLSFACSKKYGNIQWPKEESYWQGNLQLSQKAT